VRRLLLVTGGHAFDVPALAGALDSLRGWTWTRWNHPEAERRIGAGEAAEFDAVLFHDMAGYRFADGTFTARAPSPEYAAAVVALTERGMPILGLHHTLAGWSEWPEWNEIFGGRFLYAPALVRGRACPASGFRRDVRYTVRASRDHPITAGMPAAFEWTDELYLPEVHADAVVPLLRAEHGLAADDFHCAAAAIAGRVEPCARREARPGEDYVAWARMHRASRVVYVQSGDGAAVFGDENFRQLLAEALRWASERAL
jgi:type 1 glutamine amidotransferase